jgi:uncharacterized membrane protein YphA (DoxX/SURF4 family)
MAMRTLFTCYREAVHEGMASIGLVVLRIGLGLQFFLSGVQKIGTGWSAESYLEASTGPFASYFQSLAGSGFIDVLNIIGLSTIGLALILGIFVRPASVAGAALMLLYYLSHFEQNITHGFIDYHIVYILIFFVFFAGGAGHMMGVDGLIWNHVKKSGFTRMLFG